jgi:hypothetical protein
MLNRSTDMFSKGLFGSTEGEGRGGEGGIFKEGRQGKT